MTTPQQPGHSTQQLEAANDATREAVAKTPNPAHPLLAPNYPAIRGQNLRGFGWDIDTANSKPRGMIFPVGSFGHTGFTGTTLWMDPGSDTYVVLLANVIHQRGGPPISNLSGEVATAAGEALAPVQRRVIGHDFDNSANPSLMANAVVQFLRPTASSDQSRLNHVRGRQEHGCAVVTTTAYSTEFSRRNPTTSPVI